MTKFFPDIVKIDLNQMYLYLILVIFSIYIFFVHHIIITLLMMIWLFVSSYLHNLFSHLWKYALIINLVIILIYFLSLIIKRRNFIPCIQTMIKLYKTLSPWWIVLSEMQISLSTCNKLYYNRCILFISRIRFNDTISYFSGIWIWNLFRNDSVVPWF